MRFPHDTDRLGSFSLPRITEKQGRTEKSKGGGEAEGVGALLIKMKYFCEILNKTGGEGPPPPPPPLYAFAKKG